MRRLRVLRLALVRMVERVLMLLERLLARCHVPIRSSLFWLDLWAGREAGRIFRLGLLVSRVGVDVPAVTMLLGKAHHRIAVRSRFLVIL